MHFHVHMEKIIRQSCEKCFNQGDLPYKLSRQVFSIIISGVSFKVPYIRTLK